MGKRYEGKFLHLVQLGELPGVGLKRVCDDGDRGKPSFLQGDAVVDTPRRAGASVAKRGNDGVALSFHLLHEGRRCAAHGFLPVAHDAHAGELFLKRGAHDA